jgi:antitoxin CptB
MARNALIDAEQLRRLRWNCRRGLLENDLVLSKFLDIHGRDLDQARLGLFNELLALDDNTLWDVVSGRADLADRRFDEMVDWLRAC